MSAKYTKTKVNIFVIHVVALKLAEYQTLKCESEDEARDRAKELIANRIPLLFVKECNDE